MMHSRWPTWLRATALSLLSLAFLCAALAAYVGWQLAHPERSYAETDPEAVGLASEDVRFASRAGRVSLSGWFLPSGLSARTIIIAHGYSNHRLGEVASLPLAVALVEHGYNVLAFDFRASGHSGGNLVSLSQYERYDMLGALDYLERRFAGRAHRVGVVGYSMGAVAALEAAALAGSRLGAIVADSAFADMGAYLRGNLSEWSHLPAFPFNRLILSLTPPLTGIDPRTVRPIDSVRALTIPLLFIHGTADDLVPYEDSVDLHRAAAASADKALWLVPGAGHTTAYDTQPDAYLRRVLAFLDRALYARPSEQHGD